MSIGMSWDGDDGHNHEYHKQKQRRSMAAFYGQLPEDQLECRANNRMNPAVSMLIHGYSPDQLMVKSQRDLEYMRANKNMSNEEYLRRHPGLLDEDRYNDSDGDGIVNAQDCRPYDKTKHGIVSKGINLLKGRGYRESTPSEQYPEELSRAESQAQEYEQGRPASMDSLIPEEQQSNMQEYSKEDWNRIQHRVKAEEYKQKYLKQKAEMENRLKILRLNQQALKLSVGKEKHRQGVKQYQRQQAQSFNLLGGEILGGQTNRSPNLALSGRTSLQYMDGFFGSNRNNLTAFMGSQPQQPMQARGRKNPQPRPRNVSHQHAFFVGSEGSRTHNIYNEGRGLVSSVSPLSDFLLGGRGIQRAGSFFSMGALNGNSKKKQQAKKEFNPMSFL